MFLFLGNTTISFNPFQIKIEKWWIPLSYILILAGICLYGWGNFKDGYRKGVQDVKKIITTKIDNDGNEKSV